MVKNNEVFHFISFYLKFIIIYAPFYSGKAFISNIFYIKISSCLFSGYESEYESINSLNLIKNLEYPSSINSLIALYVSLEEK